MDCPPEPYFFSPGPSLSPERRMSCGQSFEPIQDPTVEVYLPCNFHLKIGGHSQLP